MKLPLQGNRVFHYIPTHSLVTFLKFRNSNPVSAKLFQQSCPCGFKKSEGSSDRAKRWQAVGHLWLYWGYGESNGKEHANDMETGV